MIWGLANMPLAGARNRGGGGGPFPGEGARRRRGEVGEELEDIDGYPKVVLDGVGGDWTELAAVAVGPAGGFSGPRGSYLGGRFGSRRGGAGARR